jgi:hypothetical protein
LNDSEFDIATLMDAVCSFTVRMDLSEGVKVYLNESASKPAAVEDFVNPATDEVTTAESQIEAVMSKEGIVPFVGILLDSDDITDDMLDMLGKDTFGYVKRASTSVTFLLEGVSKKTGNEYSFEKGFDYEGSNFQKLWDKKVGTDKSPTPSGVKKVENKPAAEPKKIDTPSKPSKVEEEEPEIDFEDDVPF